MYQKFQVFLFYKIKTLGISDTSNLCGVLQFSEILSKSKTHTIIGTQIKFKQLLVPAFGMLLWKKGIYFFQRSVSEGKNLQQLDCTN